MSKKTLPEKMIFVTWLSVAMSLCWPLPVGSSRNQVFAYRLLQIGGIVSIFLVLLPLIYSTYKQFSDIVVLSKCVCLAIGMCQSIGQTIICMVKHNTLQQIVGEMMTYVKEAKQYEREILQKYVAKCQMFYECAIIIIYTTAIGVLLGPIILPTPFPYEMQYPFNVNYTLIYVVLYLHQSIITFQCTAHICLSGFGALLIWYTGARFECLVVEFQQCSNVDMIIVCIKKHLQLRRYAENVTSCIRFIVFNAIAVSTFSMTICGLLLTMNFVPLIVKLQFILVSCTVLTEVYMYAWPADHMINMSMNVSRCVYNLSWYDHTLEFQKYLLNIMVYQKPVIVSVTCLLPELSLRYFCAYLSNAFSIFNALRVVVNEDSE